jgi:hypothetical protein
MGLHYENLDSKTREYMLKEIELDISTGKSNPSRYFNDTGKSIFTDLLREACQKFNDDWLAGQLRMKGCMAATHARRMPKGGFTTARVPITAPETFSEGEFNRFYVRGLCLRAIEENVPQLEVYRGKTVEQPRPESEAKIGLKYLAKDLLNDLRNSQGVEPCLGIPMPNSGLTFRFPK